MRSGGENPEAGEEKARGAHRSNVAMVSFKSFCTFLRL